MNLENKEMTARIIGSAFEVHKVLDCGFLEKVYHKVMQVELKNHGLKVDLEKAIKVLFKGYVVGDYFADRLFAEKSAFDSCLSVAK